MSQHKLGSPRPTVHPHLDRRHLQLTHRFAAATPPPAVNWYAAYKGAWGEMLNNQLSDCVAATIGHSQLCWAANASTPVVVPDSAILTQYERVGGYVPGQPATDQGEVMSDALADWTKNSVGSNVLTAYAAVDPSQMSTCQNMVAQLGVLAVGVNLPQSAMNQFDAGQPWTVGGDKSTLGGHAIPVMGYDAPYLYRVTWEKVE
jgi:hypothetical protein